MKALVWALGVVALTLAVFAQSVGHDFLRYDDPAYVLDNPMLQAPLAPESVWRAFREPHYANWIPLTLLSLQADAALFGLDPAGYHATNVALHLLAALALLFGLRRATGDLAPSAFVAAVFAVHPLHVESVAWIAERKDTLSAVFFALALWGHAAYAERPSTGRFLLVLLAAGLGLLAKPMLVTLPFVLLLLDYWPLRRLGSRRAVARAALEKLPLLVLALLASAAAVHAQQRYGTMDHGDLLGLPVRLSNALVSVAFYLRDTLWPAQLSVFHPHPQEILPVAQWAGAAALLLAVSALCLALRRRAPWLLVGWLWFLGMLVPVLGLVQVGLQARADRYTYLPQIGLAIALAWSVHHAARDRTSRRMALLLALLVLAALATRAHLQARHWRDTETLFRHAIRVDPDNWLAHQWVGSELLRRGDLDGAQQAFRRSVQLKPDWAATHRGLADVHAERGEWSEAIRGYERALRVRPREVTAHMRLARALAASGQTAEALGRGRHAVALARGPERVEALVILAFVHLERGEAEPALEACDRALAIQPESIEAHSMRALGLLRLGRTREAEATLDRALVLAEARGDAALAERIRAMRKAAPDESIP